MRFYSNLILAVVAAMVASAAPAKEGKLAKTVSSEGDVLAEIVKASFDHSAQNLQLGLNSLKNPFDLEKLTADQKAALKGTITDTLEVKDFVRQIIANL